MEKRLLAISTLILTLIVCSPAAFALPPAAPVQVSPSGSGVSTTPAYTFSEVLDATSYDIYLWNYTLAFGGVASFPVECSAGVCAMTQAPALPDGAYAWYVRGQNVDGPGAWSPYMDFVVGTGPTPPAPTPTTPSGPGYDPVPTYTFSEVADATLYDIYLWSYDSLSGGTQNYPFVCSAGVCTIAQNPPLPAGNYAWFVRGRNLWGPGPWSVPTDFGVATGGAPTGAPTATAPEGVGYGSTPVYTFSAVADATYYDIYLWNYYDGSGSTTNFPYTCVAGTCTISQSPALGPGAYAFFVRGRNYWGDGPWSAPLDFSVGSGALPIAAPTTTSPVGPGAGVNPVYTFSELSDADKYEIYLWSYNSGSGGVQALLPVSCASGTCTLTQTPGLAAGTFAWYVRGRNIWGAGPWSDPKEFTVGP